MSENCSWSVIPLETIFYHTICEISNLKIMSTRRNALGICDIEYSVRVFYINTTLIYEVRSSRMLFEVTNISAKGARQ
jgi:hypothetical protein